MKEITMTIEDLIQLHIDRIALLAHSLRAAHLGRRSKESRPVARKVRRRLIAVLDDMLDYEQEILAADRDYLERTTPAERARDDHAEPGWCDYSDAFAIDWSGTELLDPAPLAGNGRAYDPSMGRWYRVEPGYPIRIPVTTEELGELAALLDRIERDLGISFSIERVFWNEDTLVAFSLDEEARSTRAAAQPG
ncbi:hypothetical protein [Ancylobacter sp. IITR112]|uniref:hypothetical protein n=1 Tax=Ancylobacter sp. IITR112 TaxID=3138073 RepID=UPI00352B80C0